MIEYVSAFFKFIRTAILFIIGLLISNPIFGIILVGIIVLIIFFLVKFLETKMEMGLKTLTMILLIIFLIGSIFVLGFYTKIPQLLSGTLQNATYVPNTTEEVEQIETNTSGRRGNLFT